MKAIVYENYGPPEVLELKELDKPIPKDNEVLIHIRAVEATKADCEIRAFTFPVSWFWLPLRLATGLRKPRYQILGGYYSGVIESVGKDVTTLEVGEQVIGCLEIAMGAYAEYMCVPESGAIGTMPKNISFEQAATVPFGGIHAMHFLTKAKVQAGEKVLVNGAGGSIGTFAVQMAKQIGAEVTAVDSSIKKDMLLEIGADHFIDYTKEDFTKSGLTYDVIFNMIAHVSYPDCINALNPKGRFLIVNPRLSDMFRSAYTSRFSDKMATFAFAKENKEELKRLKDMIEETGLVPVVDRVYPMEQAVEAHHRVETEQRLGAVVISTLL